jgi:phosphoglycerate kinase
VRYLSQENLNRWRGKTALVRIDLNIEAGQERNSLRIEAVLETLRFLLRNKIKVVLLSHRGRPSKFNQKYSLKSFARLIGQKIKTPVSFIPYFTLKRYFLASRTNDLKEFINRSKTKIFLLENLRFWPEEEKNSSQFARKLAFLGDFYINEAFPASHRKNASVSAITRFLPAFGGFNLEAEIKNLTDATKRYRKPLTIILGGAKIKDKLGVIRYFFNKADCVLLGGGPANTFFAAQKLPLGHSLYEREYLNSSKIFLPVDLKVADKKILDIGPETIKKYSAIIERSKTIIWNGPMGLFENRKFAEGTMGIWQAIFKNKRAKIIVGGGETVASAKLISNFEFRISNLRNVFISTGGGAMLDYLSGKRLPGIEALK